jgi:hypothetical protein
MTGCDDILTALMLRAPLGAEAEAHVAGCSRCAAERVSVLRIADALAAGAAPEPPPALSLRVLAAAEPLLARNARLATWPAVARALGAALLVLPVLLFVDWQLVRTIHQVLSAVLPGALSLYLVFNYAATLALLLALTYSAIPILAERQARLRREEVHG